MKKKNGKLAKKRMTFQERKLKAEKWLSDFNTEDGKDIIKCYRKKFAVDRLKAIDELQRLGVELTKEQIEKEHTAVKAYQQIIANKKRNKKRKKLEVKNQIIINTDQDDTFYYIAGYTSGGTPYGIKWDEIELELFKNIENE